MGKLSPRIPREHNKYHGYTVRGTPHCPLNSVLTASLRAEDSWFLIPKLMLYILVRIFLVVLRLEIRPFVKRRLGSAESC